MTSANDELLWPVRVYYEDTDAGGIVYYANYLRFFERGRTEWLRARGVESSRLAHELGVKFVVTAMQVQYRRPARLDDALTIATRVGAWGRASLTFEQRALRGDELLVAAQVQAACVDVRTLSPRRLPATLLERLNRTLP
ncbi:MAG: tol-pal system-associated acyl-CoA thioesterase [Sutterellaceae bacterium]|nr:tol-pal system-associated acyl-CoA thioesterase [Burkholderiaceae bacterium]MCX7900743.1 tol-pal system-associated acyl-CoA thioesterase [Burkholderiaceae bacterium]MDW8429858.1 tol-pal system-associated acyl-CoA thioesterase [Sutterellaceae bacterium]